MNNNLNLIDTKQKMNQALDSALNIVEKRPADALAILNQLLNCFVDSNDTGEQDIDYVNLKYKAMKFKVLALFGLGRFVEAIDLINNCFLLNDSDPDMYNNLSVALANQDRYVESITALNKAMSLNPTAYIYIANLALHYRQMGYFEKASDLLKRAIDLKSDDPQLWCHLGGIFGEMKEYEKSKDCFKKAIQIKPSFHAAHVDLAFNYHLTGDWKEGFKEYEHRFDHFSLMGFYKAAYDMSKKWDGKASLNGKRFLIYGEQGLGDVIQFVRYTKQLKELGAYVMVHVPREVSSIVSRCVGVDEVVVKDIVTEHEELPSYDYQCSMLSLPYLLDFDEIPKFEPYLKEKIKCSIKEKFPNTFNIGISWAGSASHPQDQVRSFHLKKFEDIAKMENVKLFNLQICPSQRSYGGGRTYIDFAEGAKVPMVDMVPYIKTFEDTASIISDLDLIISADTALIHLAGAMNIPCWVLIPYNPDWRWRGSGSTTEWYSSVKLFRQKRLRDWSHPFKEMENELANILQNK